MIALMIVVVDEGFDLSFEVTRQEVVFKQDPVLQGLMPSIAGRRLQSNLPKGLDFALGLRVITVWNPQGLEPLIRSTELEARAYNSNTP
ncbi:hypothetical protein SAMN04488032_1293 [Pacificibacter marinus]|uniref:Uncharacterized protein n=1 Tax=Pacificibacter marinus TaxID=658057 RepID=A0A1Y5TS35_9RHOB|nr:hypothetical protein SAMN04488032_1293 [Pacificibacter marinus]SLN70839.1 hypothetical protein PAM7971_03801 [Pacificibacter marinus]